MIYGRFQQKIDTSENWAKAVNFKPLEGEIIVYSDLNKYKTGDGVTPVNDLPFSNITPKDWNQNDETAEDYIKNRTHYKDIRTYSHTPVHGDPHNIDLSDQHGGSTSYLSFAATAEDVVLFDNLSALSMTYFYAGDTPTVDVSAVGNNDYWYVLSPDRGGEWGRPFHGVAIAYFGATGEYILGESSTSVNVTIPGLYFASEAGAWWATDLTATACHKIDAEYLPDEVPLLVDNKLPKDVIPAEILSADENGNAVIEGTLQATAITGHGAIDITSSVTAMFESWMGGFSFSSDKYYTNVTIKYTYYNSTGTINERTLSNIDFTDISGPSGTTIGYQDQHVITDWSYDWSCDLISATTEADPSETCINFNNRTLTFGSTKLTDGAIEFGSTRLTDGALDLGVAVLNNYALSIGSAQLTSGALTLGSTNLTEDKLAELVKMENNPHVYEYQEEVIENQVVTINNDTPLCWMIDTTPQRIVKVPGQPTYAMVLEGIGSWVANRDYGTGTLSEFIASDVINNSSNSGYCYVAPNYLYAGEFDEAPYDTPVIDGRNFRCYTSYYYYVKSINDNELTVDIHRIIMNAGALTCNKVNVDTSITIGSTAITESQLQQILDLPESTRADQIYSPTSTMAQSGIAVAEAISTKVSVRVEGTKLIIE